MEWNRRNIIGAIVILVLGFGAGGVIYVQQEGGWKFAVFRFEKWIGGLYGRESKMTAEDERFAKRETERIRKTLLVKYPSLRLEGKDVPAEQNGYLALFELAKDPDLQALINSEILDQISKDEIDLALIRKELAIHEAIGKEIERIAALPERSNVIDGRLIGEWLQAREVKTMGDYLILQARIAAMDDDEAESFRYLSLAVNLTEHLGDIEAPYLLSDTVWILMRLGIRSVFFKSIAPTLDKSTDLVKWQSILEPQLDVAQRHSVLIKGEWNMMAVGQMYILYDMVPDPEETMIAFAKYNISNTKQYDAMDFQQFSASRILRNQPFSKHLSREGVDMFDGMCVGDGWMRGAIRSVVVEHHHAAALDLLIREQNGEDISKLTETFLLNPETGKPFAYDAAARTLEMVTGIHEVDVLKLPW